MKKKLFISYADANKDKVDLIKKEFTDHYLFEPLIVTNKRTPNKALIEKVAEGIASSYRVIAILTQDSINTQWINQEIGYATAKEIKVIPIIEKKIMNDLKGFVHKQNDLPYAFNTRVGITTRDENKSFMNNFRVLIKDLEEELYPKKDPSVIKSKIAITKSIDPVANAVKENLFLSAIRRPLGMKVKSNEICPETGAWQSLTTPTSILVIQEGMIMPQFKSINVKWKLIRYA
jgi:nucleoside 2-deoxyribosyltransferase